VIGLLCTYFYTDIAGNLARATGNICHIWVEPAYYKLQIWVLSQDGRVLGPFEQGDLKVSP